VINIFIIDKGYISYLITLAMNGGVKMDEKNVEVVIEAFGNTSLKKKFTVNEIKEKSIEQIIFAMVNQPWQGEDSVTLQMINKQLTASNGYTSKVYNSEIQQPIKFVPVGRDSPALPYVQNENQLRISVIGQHKVGKVCTYYEA
jgi:hypothetical protein